MAGKREERSQIEAPAGPSRPVVPYEGGVGKPGDGEPREKSKDKLEKKEGS